MQHRVLYTPGPSWEVGEGTEEDAPGTHYPDDYAGRVVVVLPAGDKRDAAGASEIILELTDRQRDDLSCRKLKVSAGEAVDTTFDDRWGAAADMIRAEFVDAEESEREAILRRESPDLAPVLSEPTSLVKVPVRGFEEISGLAVRSLPKNAAHSGTGYYATKAPGDVTQLDRTQSGAPSGQVITLSSGGLGVTDAFKGGYVTNVTQSETRAIVSHVDDAATLEGVLTNWLDTDDLDIFDAWSTVQAAFDQLWTDQGAATFTASQYIRCFAATYTENVTPNTSLSPNVTSGYLLIMEGDPADDRGNVLIYPAAGVAFSFSDSQMFTRHLSMRVNGGDTAYYTAVAGRAHYIKDCKITCVTGIAVRIEAGGIIEDSEIICSGNGTGVYSGLGSWLMRGCTVTGPGKATSTKNGIRAGDYYIGAQFILEGCVVSGFTNGIALSDWAIRNSMIANCDFYDCTSAIVLLYSTNALIKVTNCIFKDCTYNYQVTAWPEETSTQIGPVFTQRGNTYHGYTNFAYDGTTTKTYAQWTAYGQVDSDNELDAVDPGLSDPGAGDFSLEAGSTSQHTGSGSGVPYDVDGVAFDPYHPDRGAKSTGIGPNVAFAGH